MWKGALCVSKYSRSMRTLVSLDGSPLAETALRPAAHLTAALAAAGQGAVNLSQVVKISSTAGEKEVTDELNAEALQRARTYLSQAEERLSLAEKDLQLSFTHSVEQASDVVSALLALAEYGKVGEKMSENTYERKSFDLIAISTHGRGGLIRWVMGSVTERLLNTTKLPMLIVRPLKA